MPVAIIEPQLSESPVKEPSISEILASMGYGHRKDGENRGHLIFHVESGEEVGHFHAGDAISAAEAHAARGQAVAA